MGLFNNIFSRKKDLSTTIVNAYSNLFTIYRVKNPTDAQKMKACFYLCISGMAMLNDAVGGAVAAKTIDKLLNATRNLTRDLRFRIEDIANDKDELEVLLSDFPSEAEVDGRTTVNGLAGFEALYFSKGQELMRKVMSKPDEDLGLIGSGALVVGDGVFGVGRSADEFMTILSIMSTYYADIASSV